MKNFGDTLEMMMSTAEDTTITATSKPEVKQTQFRKRIVTSLGDKGGTSKSFLIRKIAELHRTLNTPQLMLVDGDSTVGSLFKFYGERDGDGNVLEQSDQGVHTFDLHGDVNARDVFINQLIRRPANLMLMDLPATSLSRLRQMFVDYDLVKVVGDAGYRMTIICPITPYDDSILDLREMIALIDPIAFETFSRLFRAKASSAEYAAAQMPTRADYLAIVNLGLAEDRNDFTLWDSADSFTRKLLEFIGGHEIEIPRLRPRIVALLAKHRLTFTDGERSEHIDLADRMRLEKWNIAVEASLRTSSALLGF